MIYKLLTCLRSPNHCIFLDISSSDAFFQHDSACKELIIYVLSELNSSMFSVGLFIASSDRSAG